MLLLRSRCALRHLVLWLICNRCWRSKSRQPRCLEAYRLHRTRLELIAEREGRRRQLTDDGSIEITVRGDYRGRNRTICAKRPLNLSDIRVRGSSSALSTLPVSLPRTTAETPRRPCEAITIKSHPLAEAASMIPERQARPERGAAERKPPRGTDGSNPASSSGESSANLIFRGESHRWPSGISPTPSQRRFRTPM